ncbi:MAG: branched-chain amino acid ABC transporter permease [Anaerolineales bacterium]|nr:MAG: branched-chain amino acid ABC transporter permease [Anaerolineales bacterium]
MEFDWSTFAEQLINGLTVGSFYALIALGYSMVYGVLTMINFAHGEIFMIGAYVGLYTINRLVDIGLYDTNRLLAVGLTFLAGTIGAAITGVTVERLAYRPLRRAARLAPLISAIGMSIFLQELVRLLPKIGGAVTGVTIAGNPIFPESIHISVVDFLEEFGGARIKTYPGVFGTGGFDIGEIHITYSRMIIVIVSLATMLGLYLLVRYSRLGKAMRAVAEDKDIASMMGINIDQVISRTFLIGSALAGIAGVMMGMFYLQIKPTMGFVPGIKAFTAAVLGGIGNIPGAMLGGYALGLGEVIGVQFLPAVYKDVVSFSILVLILIFKPTGILGKKMVIKKT